MDDLGLYVLNGRISGDRPAKFTHVSTLGCSTFDLVWANEMAFNYIDNLEVLTFSVNSDHFPVLVRLNIVNPDTQFNNQYYKKQISWKDKNVNKYIDFLAYSPSVSNLNNDINLMNENLE